ncbi:MAG: acetate/propionate family kinase [Phycisphaerae bacterium]|jgi:acetate kinase
MSQEKIFILCLNSGSSSLKFAIYEIHSSKVSFAAGGQLKNSGEQASLKVIDSAGKPVIEKSENFLNHSHAVKLIIDTLRQLGYSSAAAVGHRIVHGGRHFTEPVRVDKNVLNKLRETITFAPLHLPNEIAVIEAVSAHFPKVPQIACFDTAFHSKMPNVAKTFALNRSLSSLGIQRYGFHGLSCEYIVSVIKPRANHKMIIAHLGSGSSITAVRGKQSIDTSMGLTPAGGVMMGTRTGDIDPGVLTYLMREKNYTANELDELIYKKSGLSGVSGITSDMKELMEKRKSSPAAKLAIEMFCYQVSKCIAGLAAALGGIGKLVFTGGIGESAPVIRREICKRLDVLGIELDGKKNQANSDIISSDKSSCSVRVIKTNEELIIARHVRNFA